MGLRDWVSDKINGAKEKAKDAKELIDLQDHFKTLSETRQYLKEHRKELKGVGITDYFRHPEKVEPMIRLADEKIKASLASVMAIEKTSLRFSADYLSRDIEEIDGLIDEFTGFSNSLLEDAANPDSWVGTVTGYVTDGGAQKQMGQLSKTLKGFEINAKEMKKALGQLVDPSLKSACNNSLLSPYLNASKKIEGAKESYDRMKEIYEAIEKYRKYIP